MGFNKRYLDKEIILSNLSKIDRLLKADALIMDMWSSNFINDLSENQRKLREELITDTMFSSNQQDMMNHKNFYLLNSLSEALINLSTNPNWVDIHIIYIRTGFEIEESEAGLFDKISKKATDAVISHYDSLIK
jgi:hypothetical protein